LAEAPIRVPLPRKGKSIEYLESFVIYHLYPPPKQAPRARAQTKGCSGRFKVLFCAKDMVIFTIIVVSGMLSTKAEATAETFRKII